MKTISPLTLSALVALLLTACSEPASNVGVIEYPATATVEQADDYHGTVVQDAYRWLEDDVRVSPAVREWVGKQNEVTRQYLDAIEERDRIKNRLTTLWDYERYGLPHKESGRYFYSYNSGLQNQSVIYVQSSLDSEAEILLDPNTWSEDGTVALGAYYPSHDGKYVAYLVQDGGTDWRTGYVMELEGRKVLDDRLEWLKFTGLTWAEDNSGFFYTRFPTRSEEGKFISTNSDQSVYFHRVGTPQSEDELVYARADHPDWRYGVRITQDNRYMVLTMSTGTDSRYQVAYRNQRRGDDEFTMLIEGFDYDYSLVGNIGDELIFRSNNNAPRGKLIGIDPNNPAPENWREIIPETEDTLSSVSFIGGKFIAQYMQDAQSLVAIYDQAGNFERNVKLPGIGSAGGFDGHYDDAETFFDFSSFNTPPLAYRLDVETGAVSLFRETTPAFDSDDYIVRQVFYSSKDGTRIPMFITHRKDIEPDGNRPTLLYGYGGFDIPMLPGFSVTRLAWMEMGGVYAVANLRGGGEYGEEWHQAGTKLNKQNVFDDFIAAAEYLVANRYTRPERLAIMGGSNGGLLVGAVTNQRPELFAAALPAVGVMDMLRFHLFTAGPYWVDDYGSSDDPEQFKALYAYSPYHNIKTGVDYPAVLVTTADTDDRVVPGHSFKYAAALQQAQAGDAPVLIRIETRAGHGAGTSTQKAIENYADQWSFLLQNLGMRLPEGYPAS